MTNDRPADNRYRILLGLAGAVVLADQLTKWIANAMLPENGVIPVIDGLFNFVNIRNRGAAFGFLNSPNIEWQFWLFLAAALIAVWAIWKLTKDARYDRILFIGLGSVLGGAIGNLVDRLRLRAVIDFLDFYIGTWHWPAFNVADIAICVGAALVCLTIWRPAPRGGR